MYDKWWKLYDTIIKKENSSGNIDRKWPSAIT